MFSGKKINNIINPEVLSQFDVFKEKFNNSSISAEALAEQMENVDQRIIEYAKTCKNGEMTTKGFKASVEGMSLSAKAGEVALKGLAIAGNMLAMCAISKGLELAAKGIDELVHSAEHCKERVDDVMDSYKSTTSTLYDNAKVISEISGRYDQLSKGVGNLGNNISLTEEEFEEYHNITSKIAEMYPDLVDGWDAQGNAIINLTDSVKELNAEYEKSLHNANLTLMESKDDIFKNYENTINDITKQIEYAEKAMDIIQSKGSFYDVIYDSEGHKTSYYKAFENLGLSVDDMINGNFNTLERQLVLKIESLKNEMDKAAQDVTPLLNAYLSEDIDYQNLSNEKLKTALSTFISSLPETLVTDITENGASAGSSFVEGLVDAVKDDDSVQNALIQLVSLDTENLSYEEAKATIDNYISVIVNALNSIGYDIDPIELQVELGLDIRNIKEDLRTRLSNGTQDLVIDDWVATLSEEEAKLANSTAFDEALERQKENLDGAALSAEDYDAALEDLQSQQNQMSNETPDLFSQLNKSQESLDKFRSSIKSAKEAYTTLLSGNYSSSELLDSIQTINQTITDMGGTLDWEFINSRKDSLNLLGDAIEHVSQKYAESVLSGAGIDINSEFGQMLANIIQEAYEAEAAFDGMNSQLDSLQSSYQTLTSILEFYNENGYITLDNLQSLLTADENLIQMLEVENGRLVLNQDAYENLVAVQLLEFKAKLDDAAAAEIEALAKAKAEEATNKNADASNNAVKKLDAETAAFNKNTSAAISNAVAKAEEAGVPESDIQDIFDKYTKVWENAVNSYSGNFDEFMRGAKSAGGKAGKEAGKSFKDKLKEQLSDLDSVISGITKAIDGKISLINEEKSAALDAIDAQIDALEEERDARLAVIEAQKKQLEEQIKLIDKQIKSKQDEIKAIEDAAKAREHEIALQKAQYELERMQNQRTILQYSEDKGMHYVQDTKNIRSAKDEVDSAKRQLDIDAIEKEIDLLEDKKDLLNEQIDLLDEQTGAINEFYDAQIKALEKQKEATEKYFDSLIRALENSKSKYEELSEIVDKAELSAKLKQLGIDEEALLAGSEEEFQKLKDAYMGIVYQLNEGNDAFLSKLQELSGYNGTAPAMLSDSNTELDTMNGELDTANQSVGNVNSSLGETASTTSDVASNVGEITTNLSEANGLVTEEQTAFNNLKQAVDEVIEAINQKTDAVKAEQEAVGIATSSEMADFLLLKGKILEVKETLESFGTPEEGLIHNIATAIQSFNNISLDEGLIAQFTNLKEAIDTVTAAINGGGGESSGGKGSGIGSGSGNGGESGGKGSKGEGGGGNSLTGAITEMGNTAQEVIGEPDTEGDGTVIGEFGSMETAVNDVRDAIGTESSEGGNGGSGGSGGETDDTLVGSIEYLGDKTDEEMGESGGDGIIGRFEEFRDVIGEAEEHVQGINHGLDEIDGKEVECTIKVNIETSGGTAFTGSAQVLGSMNLNSAEYNAKYAGKAHHEGTAEVTGDWGVKEGGTTLVGELGQELVVFPNGRFKTVGDNGAEFVDIPKNSIVFNHLQTRELLSKGNIVGRGKALASGTALANGTTDEGWWIGADGHRYRDIHPGDRAYELQKAFEPLLNKWLSGEEDIISNAVFDGQKQMEKWTKEITNNTAINNISNNNQPSVHIGDIHITCPGVTSKEVAQQVGVELNKMFSGLHLEAMQQSMMR